MSENENPLSGTNGQLMVMAAHRYCLGRRSYIVTACISWLNKWWDLFEHNTKSVIIRDTVEALQDGLAGDSYDVKDWKRFAEEKYQLLTSWQKEWLDRQISHRRKPWPLSVR